MKLAEALKLRADLDVRLRELQTRLEANAKVQEGDEPSEDPRELLQELDSVSEQLEDLIWRINTTNASTVSAEGATLTRLIARRDVLMKRRAVLSAFLTSASERVDRYQRSEILVLSTVDVRELRKELDAVSAEIRRPDSRIQELNWTTELI